jgi:molybdenum cofactor cytidylyltransferase
VIAGLVLAAGEGRRFGGCKQLAPFRGRPLLEHALAAMGRAPLDRVVLVLGAHAERILASIDLHGADPIVCGKWREGQSASLRAGLDALPSAEAVVVGLGDQPLLSPRAISRVIDAREPGAAAVRATYGGVPGHPVLLEAELFPRLRALRGDRGARAVLGEARVRELPCDDLGHPGDVDTGEDLAGLEAEPV